MKWPWVSAKRLEDAQAVAEAAVKELDNAVRLAEERAVQLGDMRDDQEEAIRNRVKAELDAKELDRINRNLLVADPLKVWFQDGEKDVLYLRVSVKMDRARFLRRPDKCMGAYAARAANMLSEELQKKLDEMRDEERKNMAAGEYRKV